MKPTIIAILVILALAITFEQLHKDDDKLDKQERLACRIHSMGVDSAWVVDGKKVKIVEIEL